MTHRALQRTKSRCVLPVAASISLLAFAISSAPVAVPAEELPGIDGLKEAIRDAKPAEEAPQPAAPAAALPPAGGSVELGLEGATRGIALRAERMSLRERYGSLAAAPGATLLVLDTTWTNVIPLSYIHERAVPTEYRIPSLGDHLYLVLDGSRLARVHPQAKGQPGHVPVMDFALPRLGSEVRGNVVFEVPSSGVTAVELRYYDYAHGHLSFPLVAAAPAAPAPIFPSRKNEVVEAAVYGIRSEKETGGQKAREGLRFVLVDLRARSQFFTESDATAFDPKARPGSKMKVGTVADWKDCRRHLQLVVDGQYAYAPFEPITTLAEEPRFLPDLMTGGQVAFLAPEGSTSLEVRLDFPNAKTPEGKVIRPQGLTLIAEGTRPTVPGARPIAAVADDTVHVEVIGQRAAGEFAGASPAAGKRFLILDVVVSSTKENGETFQTEKQLVYHAEEGGKIELDRATYDGPHRPEALLFIPPRERRRFEVAFQIPASEAMPRLGYNGFTKAEVLKLQKIADASPRQPAAEPEAPKDAAPAEVAAPAPPPPPAATTEAMPGRQLQTADAAKGIVRVKARQPLEPRGLAGVGLTAEIVNQAIDRGAAGLWALIKEEMATNQLKFGQARPHFLAALALVHSGAHKRFPDFHAHLRGWLAEASPTNINQTYDIALLAMTLESYGDPSFHPIIRESARWLLENQGPKGTWAYGTYLDKSKNPAEQPDQRVLKVAGGRPLDGTKVADEVLTPLGMASPGDGDNSATQYAVLGLHAASRAGIKVPAEVWKLSIAETLARQVESDGGWDYHTGSYSYGSMTCAGICTLALARHEIGDPSPADHPEIERGLAWLSRNFTVDRNPEHAQDWHYYYLYSLERVGRILDTEFIGPHEWYPLGARFLVQNQRTDGTWVFKQGHEVDTRLCTGFALLFLTRATASLTPEAKTGPGTLATAVVVPPANRLYIILDCSGSMLEEMGGRQKFEIAREAVTSLVKDLPDNTELGLRLYGYRKRSIEEGASEDTNLILPMAKLDRPKFEMIMKGIRARGKTPMALSLEQAARDIGNRPADRPVTAILLTDGGEDTLPRKDPVKAAAEFSRLANVHLKVVGFDINRPDWQAQLGAMARAAGAQYLPAARADELLRELKSAVFGIPEEYVLLDKDRAEIARGRFGDSRELPPGKYHLRTGFAGRSFGEELWINSGATTVVTFDAANVAGTLADAPPAREESAPRPGTAAPAEAKPAPNPVPAPAAKPRFCAGCGTKLGPAAKFCTSCGTKVAG